MDTFMSPKLALWLMIEIQKPVIGFEPTTY